MRRPSSMRSVPVGRALAYLRAGGAALVPVLVAGAVTLLTFSAPIGRAVPYYSDEIAYWNQINTFRAAGFHGGYTIINERPARASWSRFGPHGPAFPVLYGSIARVTGWRPYAGVVVGASLVVAAAFAWIAATAAPAWPAALALGTFAPLIMALPTTMQEPLHYALGLMLAALIVCHLRAPRIATAALLALVTIVAAFVRPSWGLLFIPLFADAARQYQMPARWAARAAGAAAAAGVYLAFVIMAAPYPGAPSQALAEGLREPIPLAGQLLAHVAANVMRFLSWRDSWPLEIVFRYEALLLLAALTLWLARARDDRESTSRRAVGIAASLLGVTMVAVLVTGEVQGWRDYRVMTPVLLTVVAIVVSVRWRFARHLVAVHALVLPLGVATTIAVNEPRFTADLTKLAYFRQQLAPVLQYRPGASAWGNTLLVHIDRYEYPLLGVPAGVGLSTFFGWDEMDLPPKSRYLLLGPAERAGAPPVVRLRRIRDTVQGTLYENLDWRDTVDHIQ